MTGILDRCCFFCFDCPNCTDSYSEKMCFHQNDRILKKDIIHKPVFHNSSHLAGIKDGSCFLFPCTNCTDSYIEWIEFGIKSVFYSFFQIPAIRMKFSKKM